MSTFNQEIVLRPRFVLHSGKSKEEILVRFSEAQKQNEYQLVLKILDEHVFMDISAEKSHFWSPQLHLEILAKDQGADVKGLFGPKPQVWTFFMFLHFVVGTAFVGVAIWLYVNYSLEKSLALPIVLLVMLPMIWVLLYFIGRLGRDFGKKQMKKQYQLLLDVLEL